MPPSTRKSPFLFVIALSIWLAFSSWIGCTSPLQTPQHAGSNAKTAENDSNFKNIWAAQETNPSEVEATEKAWLRYMKSSGFKDGHMPDRIGLSDQQIRQIEEGICMRLRDDIQAYLKVYLSGGSHFLGSNELEILDSPKLIVGRWREKCLDAYGSYAVLDYDLPPTMNETWAERNVSWFEAFMLPIMEEGLQNLYIDLRNGRIIEEYDNEYEVIADSIADLLNEVAKHQEAGRVVSFWVRDDDDGQPVLDSLFLRAFKR